MKLFLSCSILGLLIALIASTDYNPPETLNVQPDALRVIHNADSIADKTLSDTRDTLLMRIAEINLRMWGIAPFQTKQSQLMWMRECWKDKKNWELVEYIKSKGK